MLRPVYFKRLFRLNYLDLILETILIDLRTGLTSSGSQLCVSKETILLLTKLLLVMLLSLCWHKVLSYLQI